MQTATSQGIAGRASIFKGIVRPAFIKIVVLDEANKPIPDFKCELNLIEGRETETAKSDNKGILKFKRKGSGEFTIKFIE